MSQKIIIFGFPHCGTTILKSIIGHIEDVEEIEQESLKIEKKSNKKFILCKWPFTKDIFFKKNYDDYIKIFIIRNPLFVFSSLNKRFKYRNNKNHSIEKYIETLKKFIMYKDKKEKNLYTIRYEDIFENNFSSLKNILDNIGIKYDDNIFDNSKYRNVGPSDKISDEKPKNVNHTAYRTWQINQPFVSNNDVSKIDLKENQKEKIINDPYILKVYPDIESSLKNIS